MSRVAVKCHQASNSTVTSANQSAAAAALTGSRRLTYIILSQLSLDLYTLIPQTKVIRGSSSKVIGWFKGKLIFFYGLSAVSNSKCLERSTDFSNMSPLFADPYVQILPWPRKLRNIRRLRFSCKLSMLSSSCCHVFRAYQHYTKFLSNFSIMSFLELGSDSFCTHYAVMKDCLSQFHRYDSALPISWRW